MEPSPDEKYDFRESLSSLLNNVPGVIFRGYPDWSVSYMGGELEKVIGFSSEEIVSGKIMWKNIIHPGDIVRVKKLYRDAVRQKKERILIEYRFIRKDGSIRWGMERRRHFYDENGFSYVDGLIMDITDLKQTEITLMRRFEIEKLIASISSNLIARPSEEIGGEIERALKKVGMFAGAERGYVFLEEESRKGMVKAHEWRAKGVGSRADNPLNIFSESFPRWLEKIKSGKEIFFPRVSQIPMDRREERRILQDQDIKSIIAVPLVWKDSMRGILCFDSLLEEKDWIKEDVYLLKMLSGAISSAIERREVEEQQKKSEIRYRTFVEESLVAFGIIQDGMFRYVNSRFLEIFRCSYEDVVDRLGPENFTHPDFKEIEREIIMGILSGEDESMEYDINVYRRDGDLFPAKVLVKASTYNGHPAVIINLMDLSRERELRDQFYQSQKMEAVGRLTGGIAHDINNYLGAISGFGEIIKFRCMQQCGGSEGVIEKVDSLIGTAFKASGLIGQLLSFCRRKPSAPEVVNVNRIIGDLQPMMERLIGEDVNFEILLKEGISNVKVDPGQIEQVFVNLLVNARDAMPQGGKVVIETGTESIDKEMKNIYPYVVPGNFAKICVSDTGVGIPLAIQNKIFDPFFTTKGKDRGTGLGLSTVYGIVKQHGGYIWVKSEDGRGTSFTIYLPVCGEEEVISGKRAIGELEKSVKIRSVLLVEDNEDVRRSAQMLLESIGYDVVSVLNGEDGLGVIRERGGEIDLLMTDVILPGITGKELAEKAMEQYRNIKVLFVSGYTDEVITNKGILLDGVNFLQKPFSVGELAEKIGEIFAKDN